MNKNDIIKLKNEAENHLINELLPFWTNRMKDDTNGGFITHFDESGNDTGEDEKSLIALDLQPLANSKEQQPNQILITIVRQSHV